MLRAVWVLLRHGMTGFSLTLHNCRNKFKKMPFKISVLFLRLAMDFTLYGDNILQLGISERVFTCTYRVVGETLAHLPQVDRW